MVMTPITCFVRPTTSTNAGIFVDEKVAQLLSIIEAVEAVVAEWNPFSDNDDMVAINSTANESVDDTARILSASSLASTAASASSTTTPGRRPRSRTSQRNVGRSSEAYNRENDDQTNEF